MGRCECKVRLPFFRSLRASRYPTSQYRTPSSRCRILLLPPQDCNNYNDLCNKTRGSVVQQCDQFPAIPG